MKTPQNKETSPAHRTLLPGWFMVTMHLDDVDDTPEKTSTEDENDIEKGKPSLEDLSNKLWTAPNVEHYEDDFYEPFCKSSKRFGFKNTKSLFQPTKVDEKGLSTNFHKTLYFLQVHPINRIKTSEVMSKIFLNSIEYYLYTSIVVLLLLMFVGLDAFGMGTFIHLMFLIVIFSSLILMFITHKMNKNEKR
ncbi:MAG: hypothetical protein ACK4RM_05805 [Flavobacterium sp.]